MPHFRRPDGRPSQENAGDLVFWLSRVNLGRPMRPGVLLPLSLLALALVSFVSPAMALEHVVAPGHTLGKIAKRYNVTIEALCAQNGIRRSDPIKPGKRLVIPKTDETTSAGSQKEPAPVALATTSKTPPATRSKTAEPIRVAKAEREKPHGFLRRPSKPGHVSLVGFHGTWTGQLVGKKGGLVTQGAASASRVLAWPLKNYRMDARLLQLLGKVSDAFGGRPLRIVSGLRMTSYSTESKHPLGRAVDFSIPGVPNSVLRDYLRTLPKVGVGYYPNSTFCHLDVRDVSAYWIDYAGPGERPRSKPHVSAPTPKLEESPQENVPSVEEKVEPAAPEPVLEEKPSAPAAQSSQAVTAESAPSAPAEGTSSVSTKGGRSTQSKD